MRISKGEKIFNLINVIFFVIVGLIMLIPILYVLRRSFDANPTAGNLLSLLPNKFSTVYYNLVFTSRGISKPFSNSIIVTLAGTILALIIQSLAGYTVSKKELPGLKFIIYFMLVTMVFTGGVMPLYLVLKQIKLINTLWAVILPGIVSAWNILLIRNFFWSLPESLQESARIDGASELTVFLRIIIPLSGPVLATIGLFTAISYWTSYYHATIFLSSPEKFTFPVRFREIIMQQDDMSQTFLAVAGGNQLDSQSLSAAIVVISIIPILLVYPYLQRFFLKGLMIGAVKG